ncbi:MAG: site-2 protease family protein [Candidatus Cloacimonetes bacterium]|nr:site-2 protease family protein [Candidatus Cloacimonadota bacterium]
MLITIFTFIVLLSILILIHELGHFLAAKRAGVRVEEFGLGYPPRIWGKKVGETIYSLNFLPIGGFVRLTGELPEAVSEPEPQYPPLAEEAVRESEVFVEEEFLEAQVGGEQIVAQSKEVEVVETSKSLSGLPEPRYSSLVEAVPSVDPKSFADKSNLVKASILTSGVLMNFFLGVILVGIVFAFLGVPEIKNVIELSEVVPGAPAAEAGLKSAELILKLKTPTFAEASAGRQNSKLKTVTTSEDFVSFVNEHLGEEVIFEVRNKEGETREVSVVPRAEPPEGQGPLGIVFVVVPEISYQKISLWQVPAQAVSESLKLAGLMFGGVARIFKDLILASEVPKDITGPVGIARLTGEVAKQGFFQVVNFAALLSINLGVINILPFPGLDGGRLSFVLAEVVLRRKIKAKYQKWVHTIGIAVLLLLMLIVTFYDILRFL